MRLRREIAPSNMPLEFPWDRDRPRSQTPRRMAVAVTLHSLTLTATQII
jgi:hypothetical protein